MSATLSAANADAATARLIEAGDILRRFGLPNPALQQICERDGHLPVARWRAGHLRCWRCSRCGEEREP